MEERLPRVRRRARARPRGRITRTCGSRACAGAPTSEAAKKAAAIRLPCVRRRVPPVTWEPLTSPAAPARGGASSDAAPSVHQPERLPRAVRVRLDAHRPVVVGPVLHMRRPTQAIHLTHRSGPCLLPCGAPAWSRGRRREGSPCECGRRRIARIVSQGFHRLFGGECSGLSGYIVVAAGRGDLRGLGSPMTEFLPRRPRVLGSPRLVALAKEGVPPELGTRVRSPSTTRVRGARVFHPGPADRVVLEAPPKSSSMSLSHRERRVGGGFGFPGGGRSPPGRSGSSRSSCGSIAHGRAMLPRADPRFSA